MSSPGLRRRTPVAVAAALAAVLIAGLAAAPSSAAPKPGKGPDKAATTDIQILSVSDFHGQLDPLNIFGVGDVGGAAALSAYWADDRAQQPNTLLLTGGDAVGASPPLSSFFEDKPTIEWMNYAGFTADTFGNHNFDAGLPRLQSQIDAAEFDYVSSNLRNVEDNLTGVAPYEIYTVGNVKVAVIGVTNPEAPTVVKPGSFGTIEITDPDEAAMAAKKKARKDGAKVFVAIGHLGITGTDASTGEQTGPLVDFAESVKGFDVILGDHTDVQYSKVINDALVVENKSKGATYAKTQLTYDDRRKDGDVVAKSVQFVVPLAANVIPDPGVVELLAPYRDELAEALDGKIGVAEGVFLRNSSIERTQEAAIGNLVTDALLAKYDTQIAFTNGGGLRSSLPSSYRPQDTTLRRTSPGYAAGPPYDLVAGDAFAVLPFGNQSLTRTVTGTQLWVALEHSVRLAPSGNGGFLQISGFKFSYDVNKPAGSRVVSVALNDGTAIARDATTYTAATNDFTNAGGDGYTVLADGQGVSRDLLANDLLDYIVAEGTITPTVEGRITRLG